MKVSLLKIICGLTALLSLSSIAAGEESASQRAARMAWWREARFGMFIHFGPVTLTGQEISWSRANSNPRCPNNGPTPVDTYDSLYKKFNPTQFNAADWADAAKACGMRYVVLTAKHCDGFLLWHSQVDAYNIGATPFQRDLCAELATATRQAGLRLGWYFSPMDWRDPDFRTGRNPAFVARMQGEVRELLTHYGPVDLLWFDHDGQEALYDQSHTYELVKQTQPAIVVNNRLDLSTGNANTEMLNPFADYYTPEQRIGGYDDQRPWETCMTLGTQWSWKPDDQLKTSPEVIRILARTAGGDGNLLLNVGPMPDGRIEPRQVAILHAVGDWLRTNGPAIYGTRGGPFKPGDYGASTRRGKTVYVHLLKWPTGPLKLPAIPAKILHARLLNGDPVGFQQTDSGIAITVAPSLLDLSDTVVALELDTDAQKLPAVAVPAPAQSP